MHLIKTDVIKILAHGCLAWMQLPGRFVKQRVCKGQDCRMQLPDRFVKSRENEKGRKSRVAKIRSEEIYLWQNRRQVND